LLSEVLLRVTLKRKGLVERENFEEVREVVVILLAHLAVLEELFTEVELRVLLDEIFERLVLALDVGRSVLVSRTLQERGKRQRRRGKRNMRTTYKPDLTVRLRRLDPTVLLDLLA
jgi:hypothetical protein